MAYNRAWESLPLPDRFGSTAAQQRAPWPRRAAPARIVRSADARERDRGKIGGHSSESSPACDQVAWKRHPLPDDCPANPLFVHIDLPVMEFSYSPRWGREDNLGRDVGNVKAPRLNKSASKSNREPRCAAKPKRRFPPRLDPSRSRSVRRIALASPT